VAVPQHAEDVVALAEVVVLPIVQANVLADATLFAAVTVQAVAQAAVRVLAIPLALLTVGELVPLKHMLK
jgi:hypothetical protein